MQIVTLRNGEIFHLADTIAIRLVGARDGKARLGISAPKDVRVDRQEVAERRAKEAKTKGVGP